MAHWDKHSPAEAHCSRIVFSGIEMDFSMESQNILHWKCPLRSASAGVLSMNEEIFAFSYSCSVSAWYSELTG